MATLKEIAQNCNVSVTTVSNILNGKPKVSEETKKRVLAAMDELGYQPNYYAQGLRRQKTQTIGIIAEDLAQFTTPGIVEGIMEWCEEKGYRVLLTNLRLYARWQDRWYDQDEMVKAVLEPEVKELVSIKVDGIIYLAGHARRINFFPGSLKIPTVLSYCYSDTAVPWVLMDDEQGGYEMTKYILSRGHKKIGVVSGRADNIHAARRLLGYQRALFEAGILYNPDWVQYGDWEQELAYQVTQVLVDEGVTAIFCMSDQMAGGVYTCIAENGMKVGRDIAVSGYDDERLAGWYVPKLTTCRLPLAEIGRQSARLLLEQIEGEKTVEGGSQLAVPCELVIRESVNRIG